MPATLPENGYEGARGEASPVSANDGMASITRVMSGTENLIATLRAIFEAQLAEIKEEREKERAERVVERERDRTERELERNALLAELAALREQNAKLVGVLAARDSQQGGSSAASPSPVLPTPQMPRTQVVSPISQPASISRTPTSRASTQPPWVRSSAVENKSRHEPDREEEPAKRRRTAMATEIRLSDIDRCFNCGQEGHKSNQCDTGYKVRRCYECGEAGHIGRDCEQRQARYGSRPQQRTSTHVSAGSSRRR